MTKKDNHALDNAKSHVETILELIGTYNEMNDDTEGENLDREEAETRINEYPLEVLTRSDWHSVGTPTSAADGEYQILLSTGGPACRIVGTFDEHGQPATAAIEYQDWGTPWTEYRPMVNARAIEETLIQFARFFYYGE